MLEALKILADMQPAAAFFGAVACLTVGSVLVVPIVAWTRRRAQQVEYQTKENQNAANIEIARINVSTKNGLVTTKSQYD